VESYYADVERGMRKRRYAVQNPANIGGRSIMISCSHENKKETPE
jgi:hypothetical protein